MSEKHFRKIFPDKILSIIDLHPVILNDSKNWRRIDLEKENLALSKLTSTVQTPAELTNHLNTFLALQLGAAEIGYGGYGEVRSFYANSSLFKDNGKHRTVHLGIDVWAPASTPVFCPLPATVHSFRLNDNDLDYGPTLILEHNIEDMIFYTLYGHLSISDLDSYYTGQTMSTGDLIAHIGPYPENGGWPPHLHLQIILDLEGNTGDYPGVAFPEDAVRAMENCPDPAWLLKLS